VPLAEAVWAMPNATTQLPCFGWIIRD
jgi:hypothetical protein